MPNWAENLLIVEGPESEIKRFIEYVHTEVKDEDGETDICHLDLDKLHPMPSQLDIGDVPCYPDKSAEELQAIVDNPDTKKYDLETALAQIKMIKNMEELGYHSWYTWRSCKWGTKWNTCESSVWKMICPEKAQLHYQTAWSPPNGALTKGSELFPELTFSNSAMDPANNWICVTVFKNGSIMKDWVDNLDSNADLAYEIFCYEPMDFDEPEQLSLE